MTRAPAEVGPKGLSYELAKRLKDAGFPQQNLNGGWKVKEGLDAVAAPNLTELIEACGEKFVTLGRGHSLIKKDKVLWDAWALTGIHEIGDTPEEAVANLWLALNT